MTKKDYELIAQAINELYLGHDDWSRTLEQVSDKLASALASDNPRFDNGKFLQACGVNEQFRFSFAQDQCPDCGSQLTQDDDIIICPDCLLVLNN